MPSSFGLMPVACMSGSEPQMARMLRMTSASAEVPARVIAVSTCPCRAIASASVASGDAAGTYAHDDARHGKQPLGFGDRVRDRLPHVGQ